MKRPQLAYPLPAGQAGDPGYFEPDSLVWRIMRERVLVLGGVPAVLLQLAHPLIAAALTEHSNFKANTFRRLKHTLTAALWVSFGDHDTAHDAAARVAKSHRPVEGKLAAAHGPWQAGAPYSATDPALDLWVYGTTIELFLNTYDHFVRRLSFSEREQYYNASKPVGALFGVTPTVRPKSYPDFKRYYNDMLASPQLVIDEPAAELARTVFTIKVYGLPLAPLKRVICAELLPRELATAYGLQTNRFSSLCFRALGSTSRSLMPLLPTRLRYWRHYHTALRRCPVSLTEKKH